MLFWLAAVPCYHFNDILVLIDLSLDSSHVFGMQLGMRTDLKS